MGIVISLFLFNVYMAATLITDFYLFDQEIKRCNEKMNKSV